MRDNFRDNEFFEEVDISMEKYSFCDYLITLTSCYVGGLMIAGGIEELINSFLG